MGNTKYIGRVGGLAVALGVGIAVATTPGMAWADDTGSAGSGGHHRVGGFWGHHRNGGRYYRHRWNDRIRNHHRNHDWSRGHIDRRGFADGRRLHAGVWCGGHLQVRHLGVDGRVGAAGPPGMVNVTGGAQSSSKSSSETPATGDVAAEVDHSTTRPRRNASRTRRRRSPEAPAAAEAPVGGPRGGSDNSRRPVDDRPVPGAWMPTRSRLRRARHRHGRQPSELAGTVVDVAVHQPAAPPAVTALTAGTFSAPQTASRCPPSHLGCPRGTNAPSVQAERRWCWGVGVVGSVGHQRPD